MKSFAIILTMTALASVAHAEIGISLHCTSEDQRTTFEVNRYPTMENGEYYGISMPKLVQLEIISEKPGKNVFYAISLSYKPGSKDYYQPSLNLLSKDDLVAASADPAGLKQALKLQGVSSQPYDTTGVFVEPAGPRIYADGEYRSRYGVDFVQAIKISTLNKVTDVSGKKYQAQVNGSYTQNFNCRFQAEAEENM